MALTDDEKRRCYLYTGHHQVDRLGHYVGGQPSTTEAVHILETSLTHLTPGGETTVRGLLATLDSLYEELFSGVSQRLKAAEVKDVRLNSREWEQRMTQWAFFRGELARTLDCELDPPGYATTSAGSTGPCREP